MVFIERRIVMVWKWQWGSKDDADSIFWSERHEMYEKELIPLKGLRVAVGSSRGDGSTSPGFKKWIEVHGRG